MGKKPPCACACPINLDIPAIMDHLQAGNFVSAYKLYRNQAIFPAIVSELCDEPCKGKCVRVDEDDPINMRLLEQACVSFTLDKTPAKYNLPMRSKRVVVIGAGLAGLTCALKLGNKNYDVTVYEKDSKIGGRLHSLLDPEIFIRDIKEQMQFAKYKLVLGHEINSLDEIEFDAAYIATGLGGNDFLLMEGYDKDSFGTRRDGVFVGGNILGTSPIQDIAQSTVAFHSIEKYLKTGLMDGIPESFMLKESVITKDMVKVHPAAAVLPMGGNGYDEEEAKSEAGRCLKCDCTLCREACELFDYFEKKPRFLAGEDFTSLHTRNSVSKQSTTRFISSCNLCGLCGKVCPKGIDIGQMSYDFRHFKSQDKAYPPAFNDFFIRDMNFSNTDAALIKAAPGKTTSAYLFFPGCQLGASDPEYVLRSYGYLLEKQSDTAIMLSCCGAPADWGGDGSLNSATIEGIKAQWENLGKPKMIFACPTCMQQITKYLPEIDSISIYEIINEHGFPLGGVSEKHKKISVFDPCSSSDFPSMQKSVRDIINKTGIVIDELPFSGETAQCCGWGGHMIGTNAPLAGIMINNRIHASGNDYINYCTNCRDTFTWRNKKCYHLLDIVFDMDKENYRPPSLGERRKNRQDTKRLVLEHFFGERNSKAKDNGAPWNLFIEDGLIEKLNSSLILEEEVYEVIRHCEVTGSKVLDKDRNRIAGHLKQGIITYWVEYEEIVGGFKLLNAYSHRMEILEEFKRID